MEDNKLLEMQWLDEHREEYRGQWVALNGSQLVTHGAECGRGLQLRSCGWRRSAVCGPHRNDRRTSVRWLVKEDAG